MIADPRGAETAEGTTTPAGRSLTVFDITTAIIAAALACTFAVAGIVLYRSDPAASSTPFLLATALAYCAFAILRGATTGGPGDPVESAPMRGKAPTLSPGRSGRAQ